MFPKVSKNILSIRRTTYLSRLRSSRGVRPCIFDAIHEDICLCIVSLVFESLRISATNPSVFLNGRLYIRRGYICFCI